MEKSLVNHCHKQNTIGCDEDIDFTDTEEHMKTVIIGIAGGIGSGKSTFTNRLKDEFTGKRTQRSLPGGRKTGYLRPMRTS